jgi:hypothetical protein
MPAGGSTWSNDGGDSAYGGGQSRSAGRRDVIVNRQGWSTLGERRAREVQKAKAKTVRRRQQKLGKASRRRNR